VRLLISLFSPVTGTLGGLTRGLAVADAAAEAGHEVAFCASGPLVGALRERSRRVYEVPAPTMLGLPPRLSVRLERRVARGRLPVPEGRAAGSIWTVLAASGYSRAGFLRAVVAAERAAANEFGATALFTDLDPAAFLLAAITGIPIASTYQSVMERGVGSLTWRLVGRATSAVLCDRGLPAVAPERLFWGPQVLKLVPSIPELDGGRAAGADLVYVGHLSGSLERGDDASFRAEPGTRYVFAYLGTGSISLAQAERVLPQVFPADGPMRCVVTSAAIGVPYRRGGVEFRSFVTAGAVLRAADWTLCHGGLNTIVESLRAGVPLVLFPGPVFERRENARRVSAAGAGVVAEASRFESGWLRDVMLRAAEFRPAAQELGRRIDAAGGPPAAIDAIEGVTRAETDRPRVPAAAG
jgi:UDP:flavonoid glycosyltransferase YjiC (YdhE family)